MKWLYWLNCKIGEHRFVYGAFKYNESSKLYYPHITICRDCAKMTEVGL